MRKSIFKALEEVFGVKEKVCDCELCKAVKLVDDFVNSGIQNNSEAFQHAKREKKMHDIMFEGVIPDEIKKIARPATLEAQKLSLKDKESKLKLAIAGYMAAKMSLALIEEE